MRPEETSPRLNTQLKLGVNFGSIKSCGCHIIHDSMITAETQWSEMK